MAKSKAEAEGNQLINESITDDLIEYRKAEKWNGELPTTYMGSGDGIPVINVTDDGEK